MSDKVAHQDNSTSESDLLKSDRIIPARFKPRARLLLQLGDQLIKNESIALIELVKNSYDADANNVAIYMEHIDDSENGAIIIEDNGFGMSLDIVENVWLEPGSDFKREQFASLQFSPKYKRLPIGEKGIGRFGVHKLGNEIEMTTKKEGFKEVYVKINWEEFEKTRYLEDVPIEIIERSTPKLFPDGKTGTNIVISNLRKTWEKGIARNVKRSVTALISPFSSVDSFQADFDILDKPGWFANLLDWKDIREYALFHFKVTISGDHVKSLEYEFTPWSSMPKLSDRKISYSETVSEKDNEYAWDLLSLGERLAKTYSVLEDAEGRFTLADYKIGDIVFEGYIFDRDAFVLRLGVSDKKGFKEYLDNNSGVRVFRDGMRIYDYGEPENDWLDLNIRRVNEPGKKLSNNIILGAVYLNRENSSDLVEKTNREGFIDNSAYKLFKRTCLYVLEIVEALRYSDKLKLRDAYGPNSKSEPVLYILGDLKSYVDKNVKESDVRQEISKYLVKIETDYKKINENLLKAAGAGLSMSVVIHEIEKIIYEVDKVLHAEKASERAVKLVQHLSSLIDGYAEIISRSAQTTQDLKGVLKQSLFNTEYRLTSHKIQVISDFDEYSGDTKVKVARNLLIGSLMNIIDNSIFWLEKAQNLNQGLIKKIYIGIFRDGEYLNIVIADNGTGFLLPTAEITEPFVSAKSGGMGLGLHIASEIMLSQNGKLTFPEPDDFDIPEEFSKGAIVALGFRK